MTERHVFRVVVVCAANQCRSRVAETLMRRALADVPHVEVVSAGSQVLNPAPLCIAADEFIHVSSTERTEGRWSQALTVDMVATADLILAADTSVRSDIVMLDPSARGRSFTLLQAGAAAQYLLQHNLVDRARQAAQDGQSHVTERDEDDDIVVAAALGETNRAAWLTQELATAHAHAPSPDGLDIPDAHTALRTPHRRTLELVSRSVDPIATLLRQLSQLE